MSRGIWATCEVFRDVQLPNERYPNWIWSFRFAAASVEIDSDSGGNSLEGGDGNDQLFGGAGNDYLPGLNGDDTFVGEMGHSDFVRLVGIGIGDLSDANFLIIA